MELVCVSLRSSWFLVLVLQHVVSFLSCASVPIPPRFFRRCLLLSPHLHHRSLMLTRSLFRLEYHVWMVVAIVFQLLVHDLLPSCLLVKTLLSRMSGFPE